MKRLISGALLALGLAGALFAKAAQQPQASGALTMTTGILTIGMEIGYPPFEYYGDDGKTLMGFDIQMAEALAAKLGLKTKYVDTAFDGLFVGVDTGKYDCIISAATVTQERLARHTFTKPYIGNAQALVLLKGSAVTARRPEETAGLGVAYQAESATDVYMAKLAAQGVAFNPFEYDKVLNCFDELRLGRVDAIVCDSLVAMDFLTGADNPFEMVWQGPADETFAICLKKGNSALTQALDKALDELFADGTMRSISQNVFNRDLVSDLPR
jgi:polar amino acid transport system substrate-binding protein